MRLPWIVVAALLSGCPAPPAANDGGPPAVELESPQRTGADGRFQALASAVAARTDGRVVAWGTAPLTEDARPRRFAVIDADGERDARGAYLIEDRPGRVFRVSFQVDGRTLPWAMLEGVSRDAAPLWQIRTDRAVAHAQGHHRGGETVEFALRKGAPVVLVHELTGDAEHEVTERARYAIDGVCQGACPPLASFATEDARLTVDGPAATAGALAP